MHACGGPGASPVAPGGRRAGSPAEPPPGVLLAAGKANRFGLVDNLMNDAWHTFLPCFRRCCCCCLCLLRRRWRHVCLPLLLLALLRRQLHPLLLEDGVNLLPRLDVGVVLDLVEALGEALALLLAWKILMKCIK